MTSLFSLLALSSGVLIFVGACYLLSTKRQASVLAAFLVLVPLPFLISVCGWMIGMMSSLTVIGSSPELTPTTADIAAATANSLRDVLAALLVSAPIYIALAIGLMLRTLRTPTDTAAPNPVRTALPLPLLSSTGPVPAAS
jgi:cytochrome bd-type quinol oxidase subunit 1